MSGYTSKPGSENVSKWKEFLIEREVSSYEGNVGGNTSLPLK